MKLTGKYLVFLDIHSSFGAAFTAARSMGFKVLEIPAKDASPGKIKTLLKKHIENKTIAAFFTTEDKFVPLTQRLNSEFCPNTIGPSADSVRQTKNKWLMREALKNSGLNPKYCLLNSPSDVQGFKVGGQVVTKPPLGYESIGVEKTAIGKDFAGAFERTISVLNKIRQSIPYWETFDSECGQSVLVEEFVSGEEISLDVFAINGEYRLLGICGKSSMAAPFFEEISYCMPTRYIPQSPSAICKKLFCGLKMLGFKNGVAHCELIVSRERIILLDVGLRIGGGGLSHDLAYYSSGIDLAMSVLKQLVGQDPTPHLCATCQDICLLYLLQVRRGGKISVMPKIPASIKTEAVRFVKFISSGEETIGYPHYSGLPGYILFRIAGRAEKSYDRKDKLLEICEKKMQIKYVAALK